MGIIFFLRRIFWLAVKNNFVFISSHIPSKVNAMCDALSRLNIIGNVSRLVDLDRSKQLCCTNTFAMDSHCRVTPAGGTIGISEPVLFKKFFYGPNDSD